MSPPVIPPHCPWAGWTRPDIAWCEAPTCSVVLTPGNTASSLFYLGAGALVLLQARREGHRAPALLGWAGVLLGLGSAAYHASLTFVFQMADFLGIFGYLLCLLVLNLRRADQLRSEHLTAVFSLGMLGLSAVAGLLFARGVPMQPVVPVLILSLLVQEAWLQGRERGAGRRRGALWLAYGFVLAGFLPWLAEVSGRWCRPESRVLQGHFLWHALSALSIPAMYRYYTQFEGPRSDGG